MISRFAPIRRYRPIDLRNPINQSAPLNRGLVAWWRVTPGLSGGGTQFYDLRGICPGTLAAGVSWNNKSAWGIGSLYFNGGGSAYVAMPTGAAVVSGNNITVAATFSPGVLTRGDICTRWTNGVSDALHEQFDLLYGLTSGSPQFFVSDGTGAGPYSSGPSLIGMSVGNVYRIVGTFDGSVVSVYVNGRLGASAAHAITMSTGSSISIRLGNNLGGDGAATGYLFEAEVLGRTWTASEVYADYLSCLANRPLELNRVSSMLPLLRSGGANSYTETNTDSLTLSDSDFAIRRTFPSLSDSLTLSASGSGQRATFPSLADSLTLSDLSSGLRGLHESVSDSLTISDLVSAVRATFPSLSDSLTLTATCAGIVGALYAESLSDSLTMSDMVSAVAIALQFPLLDQNAVSHNRHRRNWQLLTKYYNSLG